MKYFTTLLLTLVTFSAGACQEEDLRSLSGVSDDDVAAISDDVTLDPRNAQFRKILYRTGTVDPVVMRQWSQRSQTAIPQIATNPTGNRLHPFHVEANVTSIHRYDYSAEDARNFLNGFYIARCKTESGEPLTLVSRSSVASWPFDETFATPQAVQFDGFFYGNVKVECGANDTTPTQPVFVARRFAWRPTQPDDLFQIDLAKVELSKAGVDIALLDIVKAQKGKPIGTREAVCFWQMLAACEKVGSAGQKDPIGFSSMLRKPLESVGKAASIQGRVRQCVPVKVTGPEAIKVLGTDTWYQLTVFPDLDGRPIQVATRDGKPEVYKNAFPVTVCVTKLPSEFDSESIVGKVFQYNGFFYRIWSYPSERTETSALEGQPSPLMMASSMLKVRSTGGQLQTMLGALLLAMAIAVAFVVWFVYKSRKASPPKELPDKIEAW